MNTKNKKIAENTFPMRLNKRMALLGMTTRRGADDLITRGLIYVNGKLAKIGMQVKQDDIIGIEEGENIKQDYVYLAYHKPNNVVTIGAQFGESEIKDVAEFPIPVFPIGRLDKDSTGLIIMTNDGRVTDRLLNPNFVHEKEYRVTVHKAITHGFLVQMASGVQLSKKEKTRPAKIRKVSENVFDIVLTEGKNRQIRRMCKALGYEVEKLQRFRVMNIILGNTRMNDYKQITGKNLKDFLKLLGL